MALIADVARVAESCTTTSGDITLTGAYRTSGMTGDDNRQFSSVMSTGDTAEVMVVNSDGSWQRLIATYSALNTLQRTIFLESSSGSNVTFGSGTEVAYIIGGGPVQKLNTLTAASSASLIDTTSMTNAYTMYEYRLFSLVPASNGDDTVITFSTDGGSTWGSTGYYYGFQRINSVGSIVPRTNDSNFAVDDSGSGVSSTANDGGLCGSFRVYAPSATGDKLVEFKTEHWNSAVSYASVINGSGQWRGSTSAVNGFKFNFNGGNIASGFIEVWGYK